MYQRIMYIRNFHVLYEVALLDIGHDECSDCFFFLMQRSIVLVALTCPTVVFCNKAWGLVKKCDRNYERVEFISAA